MTSDRREICKARCTRDLHNQTEYGHSRTPSLNHRKPRLTTLPRGRGATFLTDGNITHNQDTTVVIAREGGRGVQNHDQGDSPERRKLTPFLQIYRPMNDAYDEHLFDASDVCRNCLRRIRVERVDPVRSGMGAEYEATMTRHDRHTEVDHGPAESGRASCRERVFSSV